MKYATLFLQIVIVFFGIGVFAFMLWEPNIEGRNAHATLAQIYFNDPFLAFAYVASTPFFVGLYQAFNILAHVRQNKVFSEAAVKAMRTIKICAVAIVGFVAVGEIFILFGNSDDRAGGVVMGILFVFGSLVVAAAATIFEQILRNAVGKKSKTT